MLFNKKSRLVINRAALLTAFLTAAAPAQEEDRPSSALQPKILLSERCLDFGSLRMLEERKMELFFFNDGDAALDILEVETDCTCTPAALSKRRLSPGEAGELALLFRSDLEPGEVTGSLLLHTNDPDAREVWIGIRARIEPEYEFAPRLLDFGALRPRFQRDERVLEVRPGAAGRPILLHASCECPYITVQVKTAGSEKDSALRLQVCLKEGMPYGPFKEQLLLEIDNPRFRLWKIPILGDLLPPLACRPDLITFGTVPAGTAMERTFCLVADEGSTMPEDIGVKTGLDFLCARLLPEAQDGSRSVTLTLLPAAPQGAFDTRVEISFPEEGAPSLFVRVLGGVY